MESVSSTLTYNAENRLASVTANGTGESYLYDGDGVRVVRVRSGEATYLFMGGLYEITLSIPDATVTDTKSYYTVAGQVIAVRDADGLSTLLTDHLGSVVGVVDGSGSLVSEQRYLPFGQVRTDLPGISATDLSFTGQRALTGTGLIDYHARQYDPSLRTFIQPDSIIPNVYGVKDYNRYLYVDANPVRFTDPSGNSVDCGIGDPYSDGPKSPVDNFPNDPFNDPEYSNWQELINGSPCTGCHVTHDGYKDDGTIPNNDQLDGWLIDYYRSLDPLAPIIHQAGLSYILFLISIPVEPLEIAFQEGSRINGEFPVVSEDQYLFRDATNGQNSGFAKYDNSGRIVYRVDLEGPPHGGIQTPHQHQAIWNINPENGMEFFNGWGKKVIQLDIPIRLFMRIFGK